MKRGVVKILSVFIVVLLALDNIYLAVANGIDINSVRHNISSNLLSGFMYDDDGNKSDIFMTILELTKLDEETVIKLMDHKTVDMHLTDIVNSIYDYRLTGDDSYVYSGNYIISLVDGNIDKVMSDIEYDLSSKDRVYVMDYLNDNIDYVMDTIYSVDIGGYRP